MLREAKSAQESTKDKKILSNCRNVKECPLNNMCLTKDLVYRAEVTTKDDNDQKTYIGMTATTFKDRYRSHKKSLDDQPRTQALLVAAMTLHGRWVARVDNLTGNGFLPRASPRAPAQRRSKPKRLGTKLFDDIKYENETELSKHVCMKLKLSKKQYKINWSILSRAS